MDDFDPLPPAPERQWLLGQLADLVKTCGVAPLVTWPILLPTNDYFPDPWTPDALGVQRLCQRLLMYAGLGHLRTQVVAYKNPVQGLTQPTALGGYQTSHFTEGAAGWFAGIEEGCCQFGIDINQLTQPEALIGTLCHEVAHAFRAHRHLGHAAYATEERLTDITTTFLGFGLLTANSSYLHRSEGRHGGNYATYGVTKSWSGYLQTSAMCFLLAVQAVVRRLSRAEVRKLTSQLETTQRSCFEASYELLADGPRWLSERLGVPEPAEWPAAPKLAELTQPLSEEGQPAPISIELPEKKINEGLPVFRVRDRKPDFTLMVLLVVVSITALLAGGNLGLGMATMVALLGGGHFVTLWRRRWECSEPGCEAFIPEGTKVCPGCGGDISGDLRDARDRLAAREALLGENDDEPEPTEPRGPQH